MSDEDTRNRFMSNSNSVFSITNTIFGMIVMYFIFLYSATQTGKGWGFLNFISKWYLIVMLVIFGLFVLAIIVFMLSALFVWLGFFMHRRRR